MICRIQLALACLLVLNNATGASPESDSADAGAQLRVAAIQGAAKFSSGAGPERSLAVGDTLSPGAVVSTERGGAIDIFLGNSGGTMRLTELSRLGVDQFQLNREGVLTNLQVHLYSGSLLGLGNQLPQVSRYQIQLSNGFVDILARQFRVNANGFLVSMDGMLLFAYIPKEGDPVLHELKAPPPVYFYPGEGIVPAPLELQNEVLAQVQARLH